LFLLGPPTPECACGALRLPAPLADTQNGLVNGPVLSSV
jgi:hypothetical protein